MNPISSKAFDDLAAAAFRLKDQLDKHSAAVPAVKPWPPAPELKEKNPILVTAPRPQLTTADAPTPWLEGDQPYPNPKPGSPEAVANLDRAIRAAMVEQGKSYLEAAGLVDRELVKLAYPNTKYFPRYEGR